MTACLFFSSTKASVIGGQMSETDSLPIALVIC